jgi:Bacterial SH3 domain
MSANKWRTMSISRAFEVVVGVILALVLLLGGSAAIGFLMMNKLFGTPPRPIFVNDAPLRKKKVNKTAKASPKATAKPTPKATPTPKPALKAGEYEGKVTWPEGLSLRDGPSYEAGSVGGLDYNTPVVVLEESPDGVWQRIRVTGTDQEGWIKAGNVEKSDSGSANSQ